LCNKKRKGEILRRKLFSGEWGAYNHLDISGSYRYRGGGKFSKERKKKGKDTLFQEGGGEEGNPITSPAEG